MKKKLTIAEQRQIVKEKLQKLKDKFLTKKQSAKVHLRELSVDYWLVNRPWSCGFTSCYYNHDTGEIGQMYFVIRLFYKHEELNVLLDTIAHEFAHVYLNFINPKIGHGKEHDQQKDLFLNLLLSSEQSSKLAQGLFLKKKVTKKKSPRTT
jgi:hypothetical protein